MRATQQYYPVLFSAFWFEHRLWGDYALGYHLLNVALHATSCCLLAVVLRSLWRRPDGAGGPRNFEWVAAAVFAVHPVCVESVAWISEQKNTLSLVFYLLSALVYLDFSQTRRWGSYVFASVLFLLAVGSKTVTVTLPAALLVVLWWKQGRIGWRRDVGPLLPWFVAALALGLFTSWFERNWIGADGPEFALTFVQRLLLAGRVLWFYLGKFVWPTGLCFYYPRWDVANEAWQWIGYLVAAVGITLGLWMLRKRARGPLAGWLVYAGSLFPALGFFNVYPFLFSYVADHFQYLASAGLTVATTGGVAAWLAGKPLWLQKTTVGLVWGGIATLVVLANRQSALYRDNEVLFRATVACNPSSWMAHMNLAVTLARSPERREEAIAAYREVLRLKPDHPDAHHGLGLELARLGDKAQAMAEYERAIELRPTYAEAHHRLGVELARLGGRDQDAIAHLEAALRVKPGLAEAHANLADLLLKTPDRLPEAMAHYEEALHFDPTLAWVHCRIGFVLSHLPGRQHEAISRYETALRIEPNSIDAHNGLAIAYIMMGRADAARREWETVVRIDPSQESARRNLRRLDEVEAR
ncbi:tetratricopeptide repeat protein [Opitutus terrae]|nr:tetratricopeptide repeat protein [Opitutus terrae]